MDGWELLVRMEGESGKNSNNNANNHLVLMMTTAYQPRHHQHDH